ncbi:MAG: hypothetical protein HY001_03475 [Candidatus Portnoybacteria bacterium]|nr:hypothetical protein [Candidatus Portnoybacteria bacterium]
MNTRQQYILKALVEEYIAEGDPISSGFLAHAYRHWDISPATIRNELLVLDGEGFLDQPHTSSGRVPTAKGYRFFVDNLLEESELEEKERETIDNIKTFFELSDFLAKESHSVVLGGRRLEEVYEAGLDYLLLEPEFDDAAFLRDFVSEVEKLRREHAKILAFMNSKPHLYIGDEAKDIVDDERFSLLLTQVKGEGFALFFSSTRMNYEKSIALANYLSGDHE